MALQADICYVQYSVDGTAARKPEQSPARRDETHMEMRRPAKRKVIMVDPVAVIGIAMAALMLLAMMVGLVQYNQALRQNRSMSAYVEQLQQQNLSLQQTYEDGYDLEQIRQIALEAGMIPVEDAQKVVVHVETEQEESTSLRFWETLTGFLTGMFA